MKIYLVGGAVRDALLGLPVHERDWVVVGATPEEMIAQGFVAVGKDFPVFLHPDTHEEYALARTERKTAKGYKGFHFYAAPDVTLKADLKRRDLTINAMAQNDAGELIDPYGGQQDLDHKIMRHVSAAFAEDPVRILRIARLACRLTDFTVSPETNQFMQHMVNQGEVNALVAERVWQEFCRALTEKAPARFFDVLHECQALPILFPKIDLAGKGIKALRAATQLTPKPTLRFAALLHSLPPPDIKQLCQRYRVPTEFQQLALLVSQQASSYLMLNHQDAAATLKLLKATDALRRPQRFNDFLLACQAIDPALANAHQTRILQALAILQNLDLTPLIHQELKGQAFAKALLELQLAALNNFL